MKQFEQEDCIAGAVAEGSCCQVEGVDPVKVPAMMLVQMKPLWGLFWGNELTLLKIVTMGLEVGIPLAHQLMDPVCETLWAAGGTTALPRLNLQSVRTFLRGQNARKSRGDVSTL
jgi:hypothetical protein